MAIVSLDISGERLDFLDAAAREAKRTRRAQTLYWLEEIIDAKAGEHLETSTTNPAEPVTGPKA